MACLGIWVRLENAKRISLSHAAEWGLLKIVTIRPIVNSSHANNNGQRLRSWTVEKRSGSHVQES